MASGVQKVVFARINRRRQEGEETFMGRSFREDMTVLADSHQTSFAERLPEGVTRTWFAADMTVEPGRNFMTGTLGYASPAQHRPFDYDNWSWIKAQMEEIDAARADTIIPFAIDLRDQNRWVAFAPTGRLRAKMFAVGLQRVLNNAVSATGLMPTDWEVDLQRPGRVLFNLGDHQLALLPNNSRPVHGLESRCTRRPRRPGRDRGG
jgi:hypothetical protein